MDGALMKRMIWLAVWGVVWGGCQSPEAGDWQVRPDLQPEGLSRLEIRPPAGSPFPARTLDLPFCLATLQGDTLRVSCDNGEGKEYFLVEGWLHGESSAFHLRRGAGTAPLPLRFQSLTANARSWSVGDPFALEGRATGRDSLFGEAFRLRLGFRTEVAPPSRNLQSLHRLTKLQRLQQWAARGNSTLNTLDLADLELSALPPELTFFPALERLELQGNRLHNADLSALCTLPNLKYISLGNNQLQRFPDELLCLSSLRELNLVNNAIPELPPDLDRLAGLELLNLTGNRLQTLPPALSRLPKLRILVLADNPLQSFSLDWLQSPDFQELYLPASVPGFSPDEIEATLRGTPWRYEVLEKGATVKIRKS